MMMATPSSPGTVEPQAHEVGEDVLVPAQALRLPAPGLLLAPHLLLVQLQLVPPPLPVQSHSAPDAQRATRQVRQFGLADVSDLAGVLVRGSGVLVLAVILRSACPLLGAWWVDRPANQAPRLTLIKGKGSTVSSSGSTLMTGSKGAGSGSCSMAI